MGAGLMWGLAWLTAALWGAQAAGNEVLVLYSLNAAPRDPRAPTHDSEHQRLQRLRFFLKFGMSRTCDYVFALPPGAKRARLALPNASHVHALSVARGACAFTAWQAGLDWADAEPQGPRYRWYVFLDASVKGLG